MNFLYLFISWLVDLLTRLYWTFIMTEDHLYRYTGVHDYLQAFVLALVEILKYFCGG